MTNQAEVEQAVAAAFRNDWGRLVAILIGQTGDIDLAEECAQEAYAMALQAWARDGIPDKPLAWLITVGRRRALDRFRRDRIGDAKLRELAGTEPTESYDDIDLEALESGIEDERLRLLFACCHPALAFESQVTLALRTLLGLSVDEIARAFGVTEAAMAKRLTRTKIKIRDAGIPYRVPPAHLLSERTAAVLGVIYLLANEGYVGSRTEDGLTRPDLEAEALRLAALVAVLMPDDPEALGLYALLLLHRARAATRTDDHGTLIPLEEQDRKRWDLPMINNGLELLQRAANRQPIGPYQLQARIAACHITAGRAEDTDWQRIVGLYDALLARVPSPTVKLNRIIAIAMRDGPQVGLRLLDDFDGALPDPQLIAATRADLLRRLGRSPEAAEHYRKALAQTGNAGERRYLERRFAEVTRTD